MGEWLVKKGNTSIQDIPIKDKDDVLVQNLASATSIRFQVKTTRLASTVIFEKTVSNGIQVNTPNLGYLRITLTPTDTDIPVGRYVMALEIVWSPTLKYETRIEVDGRKTEVFRIEQDAVNT